MLRRTLSVVGLIVMIALSLAQTACGVKGPLRPTASVARDATVAFQGFFDSAGHAYLLISRENRSSV